MCLSTVYKGEVSPANLILSNVQRMERRDGSIILTDLMERQVAVEGEILMADLVGGTVIIAPTV
ncbi:MAG: CooT family nickel-binding protein [Eubacteriales bacterium]